MTRFNSIEAENHDIERKLEKVYEDIRKYTGYDAQLFSHVVENEKHFIIVKWTDPRC